MPDNDLGPMPEPATEEPELVPGGADALLGDPTDGVLGRDLDPDDNPAVDDVLPEEVAEPDDKSQAPDEDAPEDAESDTTAESSGESSGGSSGDSSGGPAAGQEAEDGSVEPPA